MLHNKKKFLNRVSRFMVNDTIINITLNSQLTYCWQDWRTKIFSEQMKVISHKFWGLQSRYGLGMRGRLESGSTRQIQTGAIINPNNAPPKKDLVDLIGYWGWQAKRYLSKICSLRTTKTINNFHRRWFKYQSYINSIKPLLQTFAEFLTIIEMSTLSQQGERSNAHVYSTD